MRTRLIACLAGGLLGAVVASPVGGSLDLSPMVVWIGCPLAGVALGYVASIFVDVFAAGEGDKTTSSES